MASQTRLISHQTDRAGERKLKFKQYDGYNSLDYLNPGKEYKHFSMWQKPDKTPDFFNALSSNEVTKIKKLFEDHLIISLRDHGFVVPEKYEDIIPYCRQVYTHFNYEGLANSGIDVIFENFMDGIALPASTQGLKWDDIIWNLGIRYCDLSHQETCFIAGDVQDLFKAKEEKKIAILPSLEAANALENELGRVDLLYGFGIRCMGITYNDANTLGSGLAESRDGGLTRFGGKVVERMNRLGMIIDISHCGDITSMNVIEQSEKPTFITHAGARKLWNTPRMKTDDVLKACAEKGGVIGICAAPNTTKTKNHQDHTIDSVMEHFEYIANLVGIEHVGFGPDTFYGDHVALQHAFDEMLSISESHEGEVFTESPYVKGLENPSETMINMITWLVKKGYHDDDIQKVSGLNALNAIKKIFRK